MTTIKNMKSGIGNAFMQGKSDFTKNNFAKVS